MQDEYRYSAEDIDGEISSEINQCLNGLETRVGSVHEPAFSEASARGMDRAVSSPQLLHLLQREGTFVRERSSLVMGTDTRQGHQRSLLEVSPIEENGDDQKRTTSGGEMMATCFDHSGNCESGYRDVESDFGVRHGSLYEGSVCASEQCLSDLTSATFAGLEDGHPTLSAGGMKVAVPAKSASWTIPATNIAATAASAWMTSSFGVLDSRGKLDGASTAGTRRAPYDSPRRGALGISTLKGSPCVTALAGVTESTSDSPRGTAFAASGSFRISPYGGPGGSLYLSSGRFGVDNSNAQRETVRSGQNLIDSSHGSGTGSAFAAIVSQTAPTSSFSQLLPRNASSRALLGNTPLQTPSAPCSFNPATFKR